MSKRRKRVIAWIVPATLLAFYLMTFVGDFPAEGVGWYANGGGRAVAAVIVDQHQFPLAFQTGHRFRDLGVQFDQVIGLVENRSDNRQIDASLHRLGVGGSRGVSRGHGEASPSRLAAER